MKKKPALIAAFLTTVIIAVAMVLVGASAFYNPNSLPISNSRAQASAGGSNASANAAISTADQEIQQLKDLVSQYQQRDQQYQQRDKQYQSQINQLSSQLQQYQSLVEALQARGIIQISSSGEVFIPRGFGN